MHRGSSLRTIKNAEGRVYYVSKAVSGGYEHSNYRVRNPSKLGHAIASIPV